MTATSAEIAVQIPRTGRYEIDPQGSTVAFKGRHTGNRQRDRDVRSARFLDTDRYPTMAFQSTRLEVSGGGATLRGTLTVRDVARPVSLAIQQCTTRPDMPESLLVRAGTRIDRTDFGLTAARGLAGRYLQVALVILAVHR